MEEQEDEADEEDEEEDSHLHLMTCQCDMYKDLATGPVLGIDCFSFCGCLKSAF